MSYLNPTVNEATGLFSANLVSIRPADYTRKTKFTSSLKRYYIADQGPMVSQIQYSTIPDTWLNILRIDGTNKQKAQLEITRLLYKDYCAKKFNKIDSALKDFPVDQASPALLVSILSSTFPAKSQLQNRDTFFTRVSKNLNERGNLEPRLLDGLE